ncbi:MAG TPA: tetratricopeptide repeat protein [Candidatus Wujingus californicus]|uniref:tetratricopeptide repeat protein n=1 Tax=Candidatus Wujingus californicus TaxID=3367618 RepID=UPI0040293718
MAIHLKNITPYIILSSISIIVFSNSMNNGFVYDDSVTIVNNCLIKSWNNFHNVFSFNYFILSGELSYRPVVTLTYFIDYFIWGTKSTGFHLTNIFLQLANSLLLYVLIKQITKSSKIALISALLFTTHPVLTETVNSISYREDLLAVFFSIIAFILFLKSDNRILGKNKFIIYYAASLVSYLFALFSKEVAITLLPILILLNIFYSSPGTTLQTILIRIKGIYIGYFLITCAYLTIQFGIFRNVYVRLDQPQQGLFVMLKVFAYYIKLLFLPFNLNADYVVPPLTEGITAFVISIMLLITVVIIIIRLCNGNNQYRFFTILFFIALLPVSNIIPIGNIMAERYLYFPTIGFFVAIGILTENYFKKLTITTVCGGILFILLSILSVCRNGEWRDEFSLWTSTFHREPNSARAHHNLGVVYSTKGFNDYAELEYKRTLEINPKDTEAHYNLGNAYDRKGLIDDAIREYQEAIKYNPYYAEAYNNLGNVYKNKQLLESAIEQYKKAINRNPFNLNYYNNLGIAYRDKKLYNEAVAEFKKSLKIDNKIPATHNDLGNTYKEIGNTEAALSEFKMALELDPDNADAHNNIGVIYTNMEYLDCAIKEFETALKLNPKLANVHNNIGIAYAKKGDLDKAIDGLNNAVALGFDNADVHNNLAGVYITKGSTDNAITELKSALKYNPNDSNTHCNLGNAYISKNLFDEAIFEFKEAIKYKPDDHEIYYFLGNALYRKKQYKDAVDALYQSIHYQPNNPLAHKMLGTIYANHLISPSQAIFHLNETLRLVPQQPMAKEIRDFINKLKK